MRLPESRKGPRDPKSCNEVGVTQSRRSSSCKPEAIPYVTIDTGGVLEISMACMNSKVSKYQGYVMSTAVVAGKHLQKTDKDAEQ
ncbi:hypothetical protein CCR75_007323 [Bremia lactucae]|uniref:Uncharacterized protein n=1 Tax=Bremia lactucae TaxID=4779 RepID=A0A976ICU7_BRELC|nr:hypothetical protein CCR75_007323 [Bremia lactucae]